MADKTFDLPEREVIAMTVHVDPADWEILDSFAAYRNARAKAAGKTLDRLWSRKSMAEHFLSIQCAGLREQLRRTADELGPLPHADDKDAVLEYATRALELERKDAAATKKK